MAKKKSKKKVEKNAIILKPKNKELVGSVFDNSVYNKIDKLANLLAKSKLVPAHLQNKPEDCFLVTHQAFKWGLDPFSVAQGSSVVKGKLCYEGKLIAAVVEKLAGVVLDYQYTGEGKGRAVKVLGQRKGETGLRDIDIALKDVQTENVWWAKSPDQMLAYRGAREWARRWSPGAIQGVYTKDEILDNPEFTEATPGVDPVMERMNKEKGGPIIELKVGDYHVDPADLGQNNTGPDLKDTTIVDLDNHYKAAQAEFTLDTFRLVINGKAGTTTYTSFKEISEKVRGFMLTQTTRVDRQKIIDENKSLFTAMEAYNPDLTIELYDIRNEGK